MCGAALFHLASAEEMYFVQQKVDCILWLIEFKSYSHVYEKFNHVNELCESIARVAECVNQYNAHHYLVKN
jgi:hypothetical protein